MNQSGTTSCGTVDLHTIMTKKNEEEPIGNYTFIQMMFIFLVGAVFMFVLSVKEIENFKMCPSADYYLREGKVK